MAWGKAGSTTLGSAGDALITPTLSSNPNLQYLYHAIPSGELTEYMTMGSGGTKDTGSNYANRVSQEGGSDSTYTSRANIVFAAKSGATQPEFGIGYILNIAGKEKLLIGHSSNAVTAGAGTAPDRSEFVAKHVQTSVVDDIISFDNTGSGDFASDSNVSALGSDLTPAVAVTAIDNVQDNSLFIDKVNANRYWFDANPLLDDDFSTDDFTHADTKTSVSNDKFNWEIELDNSDDTAYRSLGFTLDNSSWVMRFKINFATLATAGNPGAFGKFVLASTNAGQSGTFDWIGFERYVSSASNTWNLGYGENTSSNTASDTFTTTPSASSTYYMELIRDGATITGKMFTGSDYSTGLVDTTTLSMSGTIENLSFFKFYNRSDNTNTSQTATGTLEDLKVWNGVTTASGGGTWTMNPTYEDDFSSSTGWTTVGSNISITGGAITASSMTTQSENRIHKPLGFTIADDFLIEFEFEETAISHGAFYMLFTLSAGNGNINNSTNQDAIQIWIDKGSPTFYLRDKDGTTAGSSTSALTFSNSTRYYVTLVNNNRTVTYTVRTGSHTGTVLGTNSITLQSGTTGLTHIQSGSMTGNSGTTSYTLDNLKIYNGVTTPN